MTEADLARWEAQATRGMEYRAEFLDAGDTDPFTVLSLIAEVRRLRGGLTETHAAIEAGRQEFVALNPAEHALCESPILTRIAEILSA